MIIRNQKSLFNKIRTSIMLFSGVLIYGGLVVISNNYYSRCQFEENIKCKFSLFFSSPANFMAKGILDFRKVVTGGSLSRLPAEDSLESKNRFIVYQKGFNFTYKKGERKFSGFLLLAFADPEKNGSPKIELWDLNNQIVIKKWNLKKTIKEITKLSGGQVAYFKNPLITSDGGLIFNTVKGGDFLVKIDSEGEIVSLNDKYDFHHSINIDSAGRIYACISDKRLKKQKEGFAILDQNLRILETHFINDIYKSHNLEPRILSSNSSDPVHINDVEPILKDGDKKTEEVLISMRSNSSIIKYNLNERKIDWIIDGFTSQQHDADIINTKPLKISIYDNNIEFNEGYKKSVKNNRVLFVNGFKENKDKKDSSFIYNYLPNTADVYPKLKIEKINFTNLPKSLVPKTTYGGLSEYNSKENSLIIEEENHGRIFEYEIDSGLIKWTYINSDNNKNKFYRLMWSRFYQTNPINF